MDTLEGEAVRFEQSLDVKRGEAGAQAILKDASKVKKKLLWKKMSM